jgi:hypothetical protein
VIGIALIGGSIVAGAYAWGDEIAEFVSGESARRDALDRQLDQIRNREALKGEDYVGGAMAHHAFMLYRLENAEAEITVFAMVGVGWLGEGGNFVTPIGSPTAALTSRTAPNRLGKHRPYIRKSVRGEVAARAPRTADGRFIDPNTGEPINGKPDLGHKQGHEFWREKGTGGGRGLNAAAVQRTNE